MTLTEIKEQLESQYGIDVCDFHVVPATDLVLAKRKYHQVTRLINDETGEVWNVWVDPQAWEKRKQ